MLNEVLQILINQWKYDIDMFVHLMTTWYHWIWLGPFCYMSFFFLKWVILTAPIWVSFSIIVHAIGSAFSRR